VARILHRDKPERLHRYGASICRPHPHFSDEKQRHIATSANTLQNNGPVGISAGFHSQVTLFNGAEISGHAGPALDRYASSQAYLFGANRVENHCACAGLGCCGFGGSIR